MTKDLAGIEEEVIVAEQPAKEEKPKKKGGGRWLLWGGILATVGAGAAYAMSQEEAAVAGDQLPVPPDPPTGP